MKTDLTQNPVVSRIAVDKSAWDNGPSSDIFVLFGHDRSSEHIYVLNESHSASISKLFQARVNDPSPQREPNKRDWSGTKITVDEGIGKNEPGHVCSGLRHSPWIIDEVRKLR
jgi:hypothetical protein